MKRAVVGFALTPALGVVLGVLGSRIVPAQQGPERRAVLVTTDLARPEGSR